MQQQLNRHRMYIDSSVVRAICCCLFVPAAAGGAASYAKMQGDNPYAVSMALVSANA